MSEVSAEAQKQYEAEKQAILQNQTLLLEAQAKKNEDDKKDIIQKHNNEIKAMIARLKKKDEEIEAMKDEKRKEEQQRIQQEREERERQDKKEKADLHKKQET